MVFFYVRNPSVIFVPQISYNSYADYNEIHRNAKNKQLYYYGWIVKHKFARCQTLSHNTNNFNIQYKYNFRKTEDVEEPKK